MTSAVSLQKVSRHFGLVRAMDEVDLEVAPGEFFAMLGPSGSGKTTCLRLIAGFEQPTAGRIQIFGDAVEGVPPYRRNVNTVFQDYALFPHMNVRDNVAFSLMLRKMPKQQREREAAQALELVKLSGYGARRPGQLSGGQRQRVALARAIVNKPKVLLLDEPLGALDLKLRKEMQVELKAIQREVGITFLYVTHDQEEALAMSDRIAVMNGGVVEQCGTPEEVYEHPVRTFVAGFIGISNLMEGKVEGDGVRLAGGAHCAAAVPAECADGTAVCLSVRPEKMWLDEHADGMVQLEGTVAERVYVGTTTQVIVELSPGARVVALEQNTHRSHADDRWEIGSHVTLGWRPEHSLVLR